MAEFINDDFLLTNKTAVQLYRRFAEPQPIIDYHCHIPVEDIAGDRRFANLTEIWLAGDHYKWRAMRAAGVPEFKITGRATDWEKFLAWAETVPKTIRNPLYHWTHMELKRPFGISGVLLSGSTARYVWDCCNEKLAAPEFSARGIIRQMRVELVCTTDDPADTLEHHRRLSQDASFQVRVSPAFRADKAMNIEDGPAFAAYLERLGEAAGISINSFQRLLEALSARHDFFHAHGCRLSDHGLETAYADDYMEAEIESIFECALSGKPVDAAAAAKYKSALLFELCRLDHSKGWVQQFHLGALRNVNPRAYRELGPDTGYDAMGDFGIVRPLARLLGRLEDCGSLAKTIVYNVNPADTEPLATLTGCFQDGTVPGKIQYGAAWWFLDQKDGIERQLNALSNMGLLSQFVGMLTDSRSLLSYSRHEYFRRLLCNLLGAEMEAGLIPNDLELVGGMVEDICYRNARRYFGFFDDPPARPEAGKSQFKG